MWRKMQLNHQESVLPESQLTEVQLEIELNGTFLNHAAKTVASIANNFDRSRLYKFQEVDSDVVIFECEECMNPMKLKRVYPNNSSIEYTPDQ